MSFVKELEWSQPLPDRFEPSDRKPLFLLCGNDPETQRRLYFEMRALGEQVIEAENSQDRGYKLEFFHPDIVVFSNPDQKDLKEVSGRISVVVLQSTQDGQYEQYIRAINANILALPPWQSKTLGFLAQGYADRYLPNDVSGADMASIGLNILRRRAVYERPSQTVKLGDLVADLSRKIIINGTNQWNLSGKEWKVFTQLAINQGRAMSHQEIAAKAFGLEYLEAPDSEQAIRTWVHRIRAKLDYLARNEKPPFFPKRKRGEDEKYIATSYQQRGFLLK